MWVFGRGWEARLAGARAVRDGWRVWATGWGVGREGHVVLMLRLRALCRCTCLLAAARSCCLV